MKNLMEYKGYYGSVDFDPEDPIFFGKLEFIKALVSYEGKDAKSIKREFQKAVDDYLTFCEHEGQEPEKPFKGSFNVRTGNELHRKIALAAAQENLSINKFICQALEKVCNSKLAQSY